ncbi:hypothetical protein DFH11DRAFT_1725674 [Phellopilus nigrolimitatus]|nr:hypothetical protein DFH11DRAFT_1725674 [Phellopilus nigrolimitatus]
MGRYTLSDLYRGQYGPIPPIDSMHTDLSGKTVIVLGGNTGLGLECARHLASMMGRGESAGRLILACRNMKTAQDALTSIRETSGYEGGEVWAIDLMDFASISAFADKFEKEGGGRLDLLVENSGISTTEYRQTKDGWESTIQTNHLGTALLALLMLPYLSKTPANGPAPRLTIVASDVHYFTKLYPDELSSPKILEKLSDSNHCKTSVMRRRYLVSKLLNVFFMRSLSKRIPEISPVTVNAVNPGYCRSSLNAEWKGSVLTAVLLWLSFVLVARTTEEGGRRLVHAAVTVDPTKALRKKDLKDAQLRAKLDSAYPKALHGKFICHSEIKEESDFVLSSEGQDAEARIWVETIDILSRCDARVPLIVQEYLS